MKNREDLSVLIVGFLRGENIRKLIELSQANSIESIYLSIDGPRNQMEHNLQERFLKEIEEYSAASKLDFKLWRRKNNFGSAISVIKSIDWIASEKNNFVILEDDLVPNNDFYDFSRFCSDSYVNKDEVLMWSGNRFFSEENQINYPLPVHFPLIWGWGTWSDKWIELRRGILTRRQGFSIRRSLSTQSFLAAGKFRAQDGRIDAWDLPLAGYMFNQNRLCILPPVNLVSNIGSDVMATHTVEDTWPLFLDTKHLLVSELEIPEDVKRVSHKEEKLIRSRIYKVRRRHIFSGILVRLLDFFRKIDPKFNETLEARLNSESI
jgi:GR25 family glycosyltransferase involved in LPS biosynthesis